MKKVINAKKSNIIYNLLGAENYLNITQALLSKYLFKIHFKNLDLENKFLIKNVILVLLIFLVRLSTITDIFDQFLPQKL